MSKIILTPGKACKCSCRAYNGSDNKKYWYDYRKNIVYNTDCHEKNPQKATGTFFIEDETKVIKQL